MSTKKDRTGLAVVQETVERAVNRAFTDLHLDTAELRNILSRQNQLESDASEAVRIFVKETGGRCHHLRERVVSDHRYSAGYAVRDFADQVKDLRKVFPHLQRPATHGERSRPPEYAEGIFAIPPWWAIADSYDKAVRVMLKQVISIRPIVPGYTRLSLHPSKRSERLYRNSRRSWNEIMAVPAQFGLRHRGRSLRCSEELYQPHEYGLGVFAACCMLFTHPKRLTDREDLQIVCAGDVYTFSGDPVSYSVPCLHISEGVIELSSRMIGDCGARYGSVTGFDAP